VIKNNKLSPLPTEGFFYYLTIYNKLKIMKHILNDLTEQEKNSIREQHTGGMKVMNENFSKLINSKLGDVKVVIEQETPFKPMPGIPKEKSDGGKSELIEIMRNKLDSMSNDPKFDANAVAKVIYNNAAHFLNKTDIFRDQNKFGKPFPTRVPFAPES
jgi:ethanolamine utilization protein EutA (predicted chaperonin)